MSEATLGIGARRRDARARREEPVDLARLVGAAGWARLAPAIRRRFARDHAASAPVSYDGRMTFRRSAIGLVFALAGLALRGPLPLRQGEDCPVTVAVSGDGRGGVVWERCIRFPGANVARCIRSTKRMGPRGASGGTLLECVRGGLGMVLDVDEEGGALVFASRRYFLAVGGVRLPVPRLLDPGRCVVTHSDEGFGDDGRGRFRFTLEMRHRLWGRTFFQTGVFVDPEGDAEG